MSSTAFQYENVYPREIEIDWKFVQNQDFDNEWAFFNSMNFPPEPYIKTILLSSDKSSK